MLQKIAQKITNEEYPSVYLSIYLSTDIPTYLPTCLSAFYLPWSSFVILVFLHHALPDQFYLFIGQ